MWKFKTSRPLDERREESALLVRQHPNFVPIIVEKGQECRSEVTIKSKYLVRKQQTLAEISRYLIRKNRLPERDVLHLFVKGEELVAPNTTLEVLYKMKRDADGFLYFKYTDQLPFGACN